MYVRAKNEPFSEGSSSYSSLSLSNPEKPTYKKSIVHVRLYSTEEVEYRHAGKRNVLCGVDRYVDNAFIWTVMYSVVYVVSR